MEPLSPFKLHHRVDLFGAADGKTGEIGTASYHLGRLLGQHILSSSQFDRDILRYLFNLAIEMRKAVKRHGSVELLKVTGDMLVPRV